MIEDANAWRPVIFYSSLFCQLCCHMFFIMGSVGEFHISHLRPYLWPNWLPMVAYWLPLANTWLHQCSSCMSYLSLLLHSTINSDFQQDFTELNTDGIITPIREIEFDLWILKWPLPKGPLWMPSNFLVAWCVLPVLRIQCLHFWSCLLAKTSLLHLNFASSVYTPI